jgi:hypothetical protein
VVLSEQEHLGLLPWNCPEPGRRGSNKEVPLAFSPGWHYDPTACWVGAAGRRATGGAGGRLPGGELGDVQLIGELDGRASGDARGS